MVLQKKIKRSIGKNLSFYLTGSILTAITVMLLVGAFAVSNTLYDSFGDYFEKTKIEDGSFTALQDIPDEEIAGLEERYHVVLERQEYLDLDYRDTKLRLFAVTDKLDLHTVSEGRDIENPDEILITYRYAKANDIAVGDTIELAGKTFYVCGLGMKSDYAIMFYDMTESMPNLTGFGIGLISRDAMAQIGSAATYYSVRYQDPDTEAAFRKEIYTRYGTLEYIEKEANSRIAMIMQEADDLTAEFSIYAPIIMIIVVVVIAMVLARTVKRDGKNIGTLMALGYRKQELIRHYIVYGMIPAVVGDILGAVCSIPFSKLFCAFYFNEGEYLEYTVKMPWGMMAVALLIPIVVYGLVSYLVLCRALRSDIVPLLRGSHKQKIIRICNGSRAKLSLIYNLRAVVQNGFRSITLVLGIAIATLCIVLGGSFQDAYNHLLNEKVPYAMMGGEYEYGFHNYMSENPYGGNAVFDISFGAKSDDSRFNLIGYGEDSFIREIHTLDGQELEYGGYYMTSSAANLYGITAGDSFSFYNTVTLEETTVRIDGIIRNDILPLVLTSKDNVAALIGRPAEEYNVIISKEKLEIPRELLQKNASLADYHDQVKNMSSTAGIVLRLLKVLGMLICLLIVVMMSGMIMEESTGNISMLEVLGYRSREVKRFVLTSNHFLVPIGFVIGVPLGYLTAYTMIMSAAKSSGMIMGLPVRAATILTSFAFVLVAYIIALLLSGRKLKKINMAESLKSHAE